MCFFFVRTESQVSGRIVYNLGRILLNCLLFVRTKKKHILYVLYSQNWDTLGHFCVKLNETNTKLHITQLLTPLKNTVNTGDEKCLKTHQNGSN